MMKPGAKFYSISLFKITATLLFVVYSIVSTSSNFPIFHDHDQPCCDSEHCSIADNAVPPHDTQSYTISVAFSSDTHCQVCDFLAMAQKTALFFNFNATSVRLNCAVSSPETVLLENAPYTLQQPRAPPVC